MKNEKINVVAEKITFYQFSNFLQKLSLLPTLEKKKRYLNEFILEWKRFGSENVKYTNEEEDSFFPAMRLLLPFLDKERNVYGIKEHTFARLLIKIHSLGAKSPTALNLYNYKSNFTEGKKSKEDFGNVAMRVMKDRCINKGTLNINQINQMLDNVAEANVNNERETMEKHLLQLIKNVSSKELAWLIRIILKEVRLGISMKNVFACFHQDAEEVYNVKLSLAEVCNMLKDKNKRMNEITISLFQPFRPMLAERLDPFQVEQTLGDGGYMVETKWDGERVQMHKCGTDFKYFSRGGNEYSHVYGANDNNGNLTPYICKEGFIDGVDSCILDGEMMGYDHNNKLIGTKGDHFDIKSSKAIAFTYRLPHIKSEPKNSEDENDDDNEEEFQKNFGVKVESENVGENSKGTSVIYQPLYVVFDILYYNEEVLTNKAYEERRKILERIIKNVPDRFIITNSTFKKTNEECIESLNNSIKNREEGLILKDPYSTYIPNKRNGSGWYKIKADYLHGLMTELDVVVLGATDGDAILRNFVCGVAKEANSHLSEPQQFYTFCTVRNGFTNKELRDLNDKLRPHWQPFEKHQAPIWLKTSEKSSKKKMKLVIDHPSNSVILQVKAADLIDSDNYSTGCTLRFSRVQAIRYDKPWMDCLTLEQLHNIKEETSGKLVRSELKMEEEGKGRIKRKRAIEAGGRKKVLIDERFVGVDAADILKSDSCRIFEGKEFCIIGDYKETDDHNEAAFEQKIVGLPIDEDTTDENELMNKKEWMRKEMEESVLRFHGSVVQNPGASTHCVVAGKIILKVKNLIKSRVNVVSADWLIECIRQKRLLAWKPHHMISCNDEVQKNLLEDHDAYGDSYTEDVDWKSLDRIFRKMESMGDCDVEELNMELPSDFVFSLFFNCGLRVCRLSSEVSPMATRLFLLYGGTLCNDDDDDEDAYVLVNKTLKKDLKNKVKLKEEWVWDCVKVNAVVDVANYLKF